MNQETAMTTTYIRREVAIGTAVSIAFSVAMPTVLFIRSSAVPIDDVIFDAIPQTFFVTFMSIAVTIINASRRKLTTTTMRRPSVLGLALFAAAGLAVFSYLGHRAALTSDDGAVWSLAGFYAWKIVLAVSIAVPASVSTHLRIRGTSVGDETERRVSRTSAMR